VNDSIFDPEHSLLMPRTAQFNRVGNRLKNHTKSGFLMREITRSADYWKEQPAFTS
jgi:hypothetical protein